MIEHVFESMEPPASADPAALLARARSAGGRRMCAAVSQDETDVPAVAAETKRSDAA
jgi:hypothetical protein